MRGSALSSSFLGPTLPTIPWPHPSHHPLQRVELFKLIAECPGFTVAGVNLCRMYILGVDKYHVLRDDKKLQMRIEAHMKAINATGRCVDGAPVRIPEPNTVHSPQ